MDKERMAQLRYILKTGGVPLIGCEYCGTKFKWHGKGRPRRFCCATCRTCAARAKKKVDKNEEV